MAFCGPTCVLAYGPTYGPICQSEMRSDSRTRKPADMDGLPSLVYAAANQTAYRGHQAGLVSGLRYGLSPLTGIQHESLPYSVRDPVQDPVQDPVRDSVPRVRLQKTNGAGLRTRLRTRLRTTIKLNFQQRHPGLP